MGLHHQDTHGRVFRGIDAHKHLENLKRDSHGSTVKMNIPEHIKAQARPADAGVLNLQNKAAAVETVESVVYVTMSKTFDGEVAGYTTMEDATSTQADQTAAQTSAAAASSATGNSDEEAYLSAKAAASNRGKTAASSASSTVYVTPTPSRSAVATSAASSSAVPEGHDNKSVFLNAGHNSPSTTTAAAALVGAGVAQSGTATALVGGGVQATRSPTADANSGMSGGAQAGVAIGVIAAIAMIGGLLFFCWRRRKNPNANQETHNEKRTSSIFGGKAMSEKHASAAPARAASVRSTTTAATAPRLSLRPVTQFLPNLSDKRAGDDNLDPAAMSEKPKSMWERRGNASENPFADGQNQQNPFDEPEGIERAAPSTPSPTQFGTANAVAVSASGSATVAPPMPNNVHRVQLDFKPSMDDEVELKSGQLVRVLHEYDDGWVCLGNPSNDMVKANFT